MDRDSLITLRLLESGGSDFDLNVTRYTNSQNPVDDRDFCANDDIQIRLQNESFNTNVWYEKRRGEFREVPENIKAVPNKAFAIAYLAYHLQDPVTAGNNFKYENESSTDLNFISYKDHKEGSYEKIFNEKTTFEDMLCSFCILNYCVIFFDSSYKDTVFESYDVEIRTQSLHISALFKIVFTKYLQAKYDEKINVTNHILKIYENSKKEGLGEILKTLLFIDKILGEKFIFPDNDKKTKDVITNFLSKNFNYEKVKEELEKLEISVDDIESIVLEANEKIIAEKNSKDYKTENDN
jgi:hypothetical protein